MKNLLLKMHYIGILIKNKFILFIYMLKSDVVPEWALQSSNTIGDPVKSPVGQKPHGQKPGWSKARLVKSPKQTNI